jgi:hypothetical protein
LPRKRRADLQVGRDIAKLENRRAVPANHTYDEAVERQAGFTKGELENKFEWGGDLARPTRPISRRSSNVRS